MSRHISRAGTWIVALLVVIGLGFGASQLFAGTLAACEGFDGTCADQDECEDLCEILYPLNGGVGICDRDGCCLCAHR